MVIRGTIALAPIGRNLALAIQDRFVAQFSTLIMRRQSPIEPHVYVDLERHLTRD